MPQPAASITMHTEYFDQLDERSRIVVLVMADLLQLVPVVEKAYTEDGRERFIVGVGERDSLDPILSVTCHPADTYDALLSILERLGYVLTAPEWRG